MSALVDLRQAPVLGQHYSSFNDLKKVLQDWSVREKFSYGVSKQDSTRGIYVCKIQGCPWRVRANRTELGDIVVMVLEISHNCILERTAANSQSTSSKQQWIQEILPQHLVITQATSPRDIQNCLRLRFSEIIDSQVALRAKQALLSDGLQAHRLSFSKLSAYLEALKQQNPGVHTHLSVNPTNSQFQRIFICPQESGNSFQYCRHFIAVDGTHLTGKFRMTLLLAVTIDAAGHNLLLAWSVVESENESSWEYFFHQLQIAIPAIRSEPTILISDRDKGLIKASEILSPVVLRAYCCQHLKENFTKDYGKGMESIFWAIARARLPADFEREMGELKAKKPAAEDYLRKIDPVLWTAVFFPQNPGRVGHDTSNIVESVNKTLKIDHQLSILELLNTIWHSQMALRFSRLQEANKYQAPFTKICLSQLEIGRAHV